MLFVLGACAGGMDMDDGASSVDLGEANSTGVMPETMATGTGDHADETGHADAATTTGMEPGDESDDGASTGEPPPARATGLWFSPAELRTIPMEGPAWDALLDGAQRDLSEPRIGDQDDRTGLYCFAAAIVWTRDPQGYPEHYGRAVQCLDDLVAQGDPSDPDAPGDGRTLAWARNAFGYVATAELLDYRPLALVQYMSNLADGFVGEQLEVTLLEMATARMPNNWGTLGLGSLAAIYVYLGDEAHLEQIHAHLIAGIEGPVQPYPADRWDEDQQPTWQADPDDPDSWRLITPAGLNKDGLDLDGIVPEDMQRGDPGGFDGSPYSQWGETSYPWETIQGLVTAARILERRGLPLWDSGDQAILRAVDRYNRLADDAADPDWAAWDSSARAWVLPFIDDAYGTDWVGIAQQSGASTGGLFGSGRIAGWSYVLGAGRGTAPR